MLLSSLLSMMISFFIIRLYVMRIKGQKENLTDERLRIETLEGFILSLFFYLTTKTCGFFRVRGGEDVEEGKGQSKKEETIRASGNCLLGCQRSVVRITKILVKATYARQDDGQLPEIRNTIRWCTLNTKLFLFKYLYIYTAK